MEEKKKTMTVLYVAAGEKPVVKEIGCELEDLQKMVGGCIEYYPLDDAAIICNDEGKNLGLPLNRAIYDDNQNLIEIIAGDFFICAAPPDCDTFESLPEDMIKKYKKRFKYPEKFIVSHSGITVIKDKKSKSMTIER